MAENKSATHKEWAVHLLDSFEMGFADDPFIVKMISAIRNSCIRMGEQMAFQESEISELKSRIKDLEVENEGLHDEIMGDDQ